MASYELIAGLIIKQLEGRIEEEERVVLQQWMDEDVRNEKLFNELTDIGQLGAIVQVSYASKERVEEKIRKRIQDNSLKPVTRSYRKYWWAAASIIIACLLGGLIFIRDSRRGKSFIDKHRPIADIAAPGSSKPVLKMADGQLVSLDTLKDALLTIGDDIQLIKGPDGTLVYKSVTGKKSLALQNNTLFNPRGSKVVNVTLSDGTRIWLNAGSSISYPVIFSGKERRVTIDGEAYFEVAHNAAKPFVVNKQNIDIRVLGTKFNVNAYSNESGINTVLLEGSVKVSNRNQSIVLAPGQQVKSLSDGSGKLNVSKADFDKAMNWRGDFFRFDLFSLPEAIKQLERWYDIEIIVLTSDIDGVNLSGDMNRSTSLSSVIKILEYSGLKCELLPNRKLTISKR